MSKELPVIAHMAGVEVGNGANGRPLYVYCIFFVLLLFETWESFNNAKVSFKKLFEQEKKKKSDDIAKVRRSGTQSGALWCCIWMGPIRQLEQYAWNGLGTGFWSMFCGKNREVPKEVISGSLCCRNCLTSPSGNNGQKYLLPIKKGVPHLRPGATDDWVMAMRLVPPVQQAPQGSTSDKLETLIPMQLFCLSLLTSPAIFNPAHCGQLSLSPQKRAAAYITFSKTPHASGLPFHCCDLLFHSPSFWKTVGLLVCSEEGKSEWNLHTHVQPHLWFSFATAWTIPFLGLNKPHVLTLARLQWDLLILMYLTTYHSKVACRSEESASPRSLMEMPSLGTHLPPRLNEARSAFQQDVQVICKCVTDWEVCPLETFCILKRYHWGDKARWQVLKGKPSTSISVKYSSPLKSTCRTYNKRWAGRGKSSTSSPYGTFRKK